MSPIWTKKQPEQASGLRIGVYVHSCLPFLRAGSEVMLHAMLKALQGQGHEVRVAATQTKKAPADWFYDGVDGFGHPEGPRDESPAKRLGDWRPDVVITHHGESQRAAAFARQHGAKLVLIVHNDHQITKGLIRSLRPDLTVFNTRHIHGASKAYLRDRRGVQLAAVVMHPPVDPSKHAAIPGKAITLINLHPKKGSNLFYKLADQLPQLEFLGVKGGYWTNQDVRDPLPDNVTVIENTDDMRRDVWARTGVLLVPSVYESYGLVAVEAMASGIPVVAAPTPGLKEALTGSAGEAGIFAPLTSFPTWVEVLKRLDDPAEWKQWSKRSLARSKEIAAEDDMQRFLSAVDWAIVGDKE